MGEAQDSNQETKPARPAWVRLAKRVLHSGLPLPGPLRSIVRALHRSGCVGGELLTLMYAWFIAGPVLRSVAEVGESLRIEKIPYIRGPGRIVIGDRAYISGKVDVAFSRQSGPAPTLVIGDDVFIGHECSFAMARGIEIGSHCLLAGGVRIQDNDGHPLDAARRHAGEPVDTANVKPVRIEDGVWIGQRCQVLKGVTIGRNSVIGAGSVVTKDIPADSLAAGVPAKVIRKLKDES